MLHGHVWAGQDLTGWLASEKLDGCRGYWDGAAMWSRSGRAIPLPREWTDALPRTHLDGEIWAGRGRFQDACNAVLHGRWTAGVCWMVFDAPQEAGTWAERLAAAGRSLGKCAFAATVPWVKLRDNGHAAHLLAAILGKGGEGLMLRHPEQVGYRGGRSRLVLKLRPKAALRGRGRRTVLQRL